MELIHYAEPSGLTLVRQRLPGTGPQCCNPSCDCHAVRYLVGVASLHTKVDRVGCHCRVSRVQFLQGVSRLLWKVYICMYVCSCSSSARLGGPVCCYICKANNLVRSILIVQRGLTLLDVRNSMTYKRFWGTILVKKTILMLRMEKYWFRESTTSLRMLDATRVSQNTFTLSFQVSAVCRGGGSWSALRVNIAFMFKSPFGLPGTRSLWPLANARAFFLLCLSRRKFCFGNAFQLPRHSLSFSQTPRISWELSLRP